MNPKLKTLYLTNAISVFTTSLILPYFAIFIGTFDKSLQTVGVLLALQILSLIVTTSALMKNTDQKYNQPKLVAYGWMLVGLSWLGLAASQNSLHLALFIILNGLGNGLTNSTWNSLVSDHLDSKHHLKDYSLWTILSQAIVGVAALLAPQIIQRVGFPGLLIIMAVPQFLTGVVLLRFYSK